MKKIRRTLTIAAAAIALTAGLTPAASAQGLGDLLGGNPAINTAIDNFPCTTMGELLTHGGMVTSETTRAELAATLKDSAEVLEIGPIVNIQVNAYSQRIANRALTCDIVKADPPQDIFAQLQTISSNLSS